MAENEIVVGQYPVPSRDGSDYKPNSPQPTVDQVLLELLEEEIEGDFIIIAIGELGSPGAKHGISGIAKVIDSVADIENLAVQPGSTQQRWSDLFGAVTPFKHVSSIIIRRMS